ncbi:MAG: GyrI-like domain-containing protein [Promethearchaeota archaeon]
MTIKPIVTVVSEEAKILQLVGSVFYGDPFHAVGGWDPNNEIGLTWKRFMQLYQQHEARITSLRVDPDVSYEVHIEPAQYKEDKKYYVFVGVEVTELKDIPLELFGLTLPETLYATFTFKGKGMFKGGDYIWKQWLPNSAYIESYPFMMEAYHATRFRGLNDDESELDWIVPVRRRA